MNLTESQAREEICRVGRSLFERGYVHATAGNISVRLDDGFLITPTDACLGFLDPARLAKLDLQGQQVSGDKGSKTIAMHRYAERGTPIRAVMLPRLGPNVWHATPAAAMATLEELEETARLLLLQPHTPPLRAGELDELRQTFGARW
jgi:ribulose-5-phosphate 4-epimerase/fuculose-1-phosphate aldolase